MIYEEDGICVFSGALSTYYISISALYNQADDVVQNPDDVTTDIAWISYSEVE